MRDVLITTHLLKQPRDAAVARAEADERLEPQAQARLRAKPAEPGRSSPWPAVSAPWWHGEADRCPDPTRLAGGSGCGGRHSDDLHDQ
jgi:hypothetical protein